MSGDRRAIVELRTRIAASEANCPFCGYNLRELASDNCPECGKGVEEIGALIDRQGNPSFAGQILGLTMILAIPVTLFTAADYVESTVDYCWWEWMEVLSLLATLIYLVLLVVGLWVLGRRAPQLYRLPRRRWPWLALARWLVVIALYALIAWQLHALHPFRNRSGSPFHDAVATGNSSLIVREARRLPDIDVEFNPSTTPLSMAIETHDPELVRTFLAMGADPLHAFRPNDSVLEHAFFRGGLEVMEVLLEAGIDPDSPETGWGCTVLGLAAGDSRLDLAALLVEEGADLEHRGINERTVLHIALGGRHSLRSGYRPPQQDEMVLYLLQVGADPNAVDAFGATPLMLASNGAGLDVIRELVRLGVDVNARDHKGRSALVYASRDKEPAIVELLLEAGANPNIADAEGTTPLSIAIARDQLSLVEILLQGGADPSRTTIDGTPLPQLVNDESDPSDRSLRLVREYLDASQ